MRVLAKDVQTNETRPFLQAVGIHPAARQNIVQTILMQHRNCEFGDYQGGQKQAAASIWAGLTFLKEEYDIIVAAADTSSEELANTLVVQCTSGLVLPARECAVSGILGCECNCCVSRTKTLSKAYHSAVDSSVAISPALRLVKGESTGGGALSVTDTREWEAFFLAIGVALHNTACKDEDAPSHAQTGKGLASLANDDNCPICLESLPLGKRSSVLPCGHRFCPNCIMKWLVSSDNVGKCPLCRQSTPTYTVTELPPDPLCKAISLSFSAAIAGISS
eukprot:SAG31_NODE_11555_length_1018_cov_1.094668_1_plen_277_part_10